MAKVLKSFQDKVTGNVYHPGDLYTDDRVEELTGLGFLEKEAKEKKKSKAAKDDK